MMFLLMLAASASFASPFGYQTNLMVLGAGGYVFGDFVRLGVPLQALQMVVSIAVVRYAEHWCARARGAAKGAIPSLCPFFVGVWNRAATTRALLDRGGSSGGRETRWERNNGALSPKAGSVCVLRRAREREESTKRARHS